APGEGPADPEQGAGPVLAVGDVLRGALELAEDLLRTLAPADVEPGVERGGRGGDALGDVGHGEAERERAVEQPPAHLQREERGGDGLAGGGEGPDPDGLLGE